MNRSEELCKLLNLDKYKSCGNCNPPSSLCCGGCEQEEEHYPDLTKPSNFMKLLKIYGAVCTYIKMIISEDGNELEDDLITDIIEVMSSHKKQLKILQGKAQATKWDY